MPSTYSMNIWQIYFFRYLFSTYLVGVCDFGEVLSLTVINMKDQMTMLLG